VSKKYGTRSWARYPIFWGLEKIGQLPNPDPSDVGALSASQRHEGVVIDVVFEGRRGDLRRQAQEWAGLKYDEEAELLVFVGSWSMQKGMFLPSIVLFPVAQWVASLETLQRTAIKIHQKEAISKDDRSRLRTPITRAHSPGFPSINSDRSRSIGTAFHEPRHRRSVRHESPQPQTAVPTVPSTHPVCPGRIPFRPNTASSSFAEPIRLGRTLSRPGRLGRSISPSFRPSSHLGLEPPQLNPGLPCLRHPRHATDLHLRSLGLGFALSSLKSPHSNLNFHLSHPIHRLRPPPTHQPHPPRRPPE
jgi:hypothetical protein